MILGIGNDLIDIRRIENTLNRFGERFTARIFTKIEQEKSEKSYSRVASFAKRFAAKEACAKALGTGIRKGVYWRDMGVINLSTGKPTMELTGGANSRLEQLVPEGMVARIDITITDDMPFASAVVIISANPYEK